MTSLNDEILDQWSKEQNKSKLADQVLLKWNKLNNKHTALLTESEEMKLQIKELLAENNVTRQKFTNLLDSFQQFILNNEQS